MDNFDAATAAARLCAPHKDEGVPARPVDDDDYFGTDDYFGRDRFFSDQPPSKKESSQ